MKIAKNTVVTMDYTLTDEEGEILDSSNGGEPLVFLSGHGNIIAGLEAVLQGQAKGDKLDVTVKPEDAYGEYSSELVAKVPKAHIQADGEIAAGAHFQVDTPEGPMIYTVTHVDGDDVTLDGNHPLAGETLNFKVEVVDVREASEEEVTAGHIQSPESAH
ncbi:MAG: peptidylprolyl isomerase [Oligoflexales bacterium]|nr:peptidylprolyl isomerase [Oligoflexales bacterium]